MFLQKI